MGANIENKSYICALIHLQHDMRHSRHTAFAAIILLAFFSVSCSNEKKGIIPEDVMSMIYYDIYMTDEAVQSNYRFKRMADTMRIYEPVFNKYGYTTDDYNRSVVYYLERPDRFEDVFVKTKNMLEIRKSQLQKILQLEGKRPKRWELIDSLELYTADSIHAGIIYKNMRIMFFKPDSILPGSPVIDSSLIKRPVNQFLIFSDSALNADKYFIFYDAMPFMTEVEMLKARMDSTEKKNEYSMMPVDSHDKDRESVIRRIRDDRKRSILTNNRIVHNKHDTDSKK